MNRFSFSLRTFTMVGLLIAASVGLITQEYRYRKEIDSARTKVAKFERELNWLKNQMSPQAGKLVIRTYDCWGGDSYVDVDISENFRKMLKAYQAAMIRYYRVRNYRACQEI